MLLFLSIATFPVKTRTDFATRFRARYACLFQSDKQQKSSQLQAALHSNLADFFHEAGRTEDAISQLKLSARIHTEIDVEAGTMRPEIWKLVEW